MRGVAFVWQMLAIKKGWWLRVQTWQMLPPKGSWNVRRTIDTVWASPPTWLLNMSGHQAAQSGTWTPLCFFSSFGELKFYTGWESMTSRSNLEEGQGLSTLYLCIYVILLISNYHLYACLVSVCSAINLVSPDTSYQTIPAMNTRNTAIWSKGRIPNIFLPHSSWHYIIRHWWRTGAKDIRSWSWFEKLKCLEGTEVHRPLPPIPAWKRSHVKVETLKTSRYGKRGNFGLVYQHVE